MLNPVQPFISRPFALLSQDAKDAEETFKSLGQTITLDTVEEALKNQLSE